MALIVTISADTWLQWSDQNINLSAVAVGFDQPVTYDWDMGNSTSSPSTTSAFSYNYGSYGERTITVTVSDSDEISAASHQVTINRLPSIVYTGTLSAGEDITFADNSSLWYFPDTVVSADWNFGDGSTSSTPDVSASLVHQYASIGNYTVSVTAYDVSGNEGVNSTNVPLFSIAGATCTLKNDYIQLCGPKENARYGDSRNINLVEYLPLYLRGGEAEAFTQLFEDYLNEMFDGLDGFGTSSTSLNITEGYESFPKGSGSDANWPRENTYSATSANPAVETDATDVQSIAISNPANTANQKISILEKVQRIAELHDPDLIDLEYIQHFANNLGYDIDINRNEVGISAAGSLGTGDFGDDSSCLASDSDRYLRFTVRNLPTWYKIKTTDNAIKVMLYSFGLVGELIEYFTDSYSATSDGGKWRLDYTGEFTDIDPTWFPTPHFAISINIDDSANITDDVNRRKKVINAIESVRPINTVFKKLAAYLKRTSIIYVGAVMRMRRYIQIQPDGWANGWDSDLDGVQDGGTPPEWSAHE